MKKIIFLLCLLPIFAFSQKVCHSVDDHQFHSPNCNHVLQKTEVKNDLMHNYDVCFYGLDIAVTNENDYVSGNTTIKAKVVDQPLSTFVIELINQLNVEKVLFNNEEVAFTHGNDELSIGLTNNIPVNEYFNVQIFYEGESGEEGMQHEIDEDWGFPVTFTLSETWHAKEWFPCKEVLSDKADSVYVFITTNSTCKAAGNGLLYNTVYLPDGKVRYEWKSKLKTTYYLIFVIVADYTEYNIYSNPEAASEPILIQNYLYDNPDCLIFNQDLIDVTADMLVLFSDKYGLYPFHKEKYGHAMWPWGGAMEHQTMTTTGTFDFGYTSHELGHSWFGDYVTCATWQDIWINEGFASYSEYIAIENLANEEYEIGHLNHAERYARNATEGSIYLSFEDAQNESAVFNYSLTYRKGLMLVHMIRYIIDDDELFFTVLKNFVNQYADSVAKGIDFKEVLEETTNIDFTNYFDQWFFGEGYPIYHVEWNQTGNAVDMNIIQETTSESTNFFDIPLEIKFFGENQSALHKIDITSNTQSENINIPFTIDSLQIDPNNWILNGIGSIVNSIDNQTFALDKRIHVYPNPAQNETTLEFHHLQGQQIQFELVNISNQVVFSDKILCNSEISKYNLVLDYLPNGLYFILIKNENTTIGKRLMKL
jgi:aminopeptidase N